MTITKPVPIDPVAPVAPVAEGRADNFQVEPPPARPGGSVEATMAMLDNALRPLAPEGRSRELAMSFGAFMATRK